MKRHRFERRKPKTRNKFRDGGNFQVDLSGLNAHIDQYNPTEVNPSSVTDGQGGFNLGNSGVDSLISVGSNLLNRQAISNLETEVTPTTVPDRRRNYRSFLGETKRMLDRDYRGGMRQLGDNALDGELGKAKLMSARLNAGSDAAVQDAMAREQFETGQDSRQDRNRTFNAGLINQAKEGNLNRRNQKIGAEVSNNRAFAQETLDINAKSAQMDYDTQALLMKAIENSDTQVLARAAKQFGYDDVEMFIQDFMNRKLARR